MSQRECEPLKTSSCIELAGATKGFYSAREYGRTEVRKTLKHKCNLAMIGWTVKSLKFINNYTMFELYCLHVQNGHSPPIV